MSFSAALAFYRTRTSPLPMGATLPTFAVTFVPCLVASIALGSKMSRADEQTGRETPAAPAA